MTFMEICQRSISIKLLLFLLLPAAALYPEPVGPEPDNSQSLFEKTIAIDVSTADFHELAAWCRQLGLDEKGTKSELQQRLLSYYRQEKQEKDLSSKNILMIESAERTEYFNIEMIDENYIRVTGNVIVRMEDREKQTQHTIVTDQILLNQENNLITAFGNVVYTRKSREGEEVFQGEKLSFNIDNWEGVFIQGTSEKNKKQDDKELIFRYSGDTIYRAENDLVIIDNAEITSSKPVDPYYSLKAKRIWVLAPGEWGIKNAVLYVGHIPVFYFPFFFHAGDKLVFNPSFGIRTPVGFFLQTTTYLKGEPSASQNLSFLALTEEDAKYETELRGLYLRKTRKKEEISPDDNYVKIMFDIYSRLGVFAGIEGKTETSEFYAGVGRSRNIYISPSGRYTPFYENENGEFNSGWNSGNLLDLSLPLRFGLELETENSYKRFNYNLSMDMYSDPYFLRDFNDRAEKTDWSKMMGLEEEETDTDTNTAIMERLWWYFHGSYRYAENSSTPTALVSEININKIDFSMNWKNKKQPAEGFSGIDPDMDNYIPYSARTDFFYPEQYFYYPEYYKFPDLSMTIRGNLFSESYGKREAVKQDKKDSALKESYIVSPWPDAKKGNSAFDSDENESGSSRILAWERMKDENVKMYKKRDYFYHAMTYTLSPNFSVTETMDYTEWEKPAQISFDKAYSSMRTYGNAGVNYKAEIYDDLLMLNNNLVFTGDYRTHYNRSETIADATWDSYLLQDYKASYYKLENKSLFTSYPLYKYEMYDQSFVTYQVDTILLKKEFDYMDDNNNPVYRDSLFSMDKEYFTKHEASFNLKYLANWNQIQHFRVKTVLPPLLQEVENENIIRTGPLTSTLIVEAKEETEDNWVPGDFTWKEKLARDNFTYIEHILIYDGYGNELDSSETIGRISLFYDELYFRQNILYGFPEKSMTEAVSLLNLWFFQAQYKAEWMYPKKYEQGFGWLEEEDEKFVASEFSAKIDFTKYFMPKWRNRVRYKTNIAAGWVMDLQEYTENALVFDFGFDLNVHKFLDLSFNSRSENNNTYRYFPSLAENMGEEWVNPVTDIIKSFNFFDGGTQRYESFFKLKKIDVKAVHHLGDWDLTLIYTGSPNLFQPSSGVPEWRWESETTIMMQWNPIKEIKTRINIADDVISM